MTCKNWEELRWFQESQDSTPWYGPPRLALSLRQFVALSGWICHSTLRAWAGLDVEWPTDTWSIFGSNGSHVIMWLHSEGLLLKSVNISKCQVVTCCFFYILLKLFFIFSQRHWVKMVKYVYIFLKTIWRHMMFLCRGNKPECRHRRTSSCIRGGEICVHCVFLSSLHLTEQTMSFSSKVHRQKFIPCSQNPAHRG